MHQGQRTLVSSEPRPRRIWPWLLLLLVLTVGASFAGVAAFLAHRATSLPASASAHVATSATPSTASAPSVQIATSTAPSVAGAHSNAPATHVAATVAAHEPPPASIPLGVAVSGPPMQTPGSGTFVNGSSSDSTCIAANDVISQSRPAISGCFQQFRFDPPEHETVGYLAWVELAGEVSNVERLASSPSVPRLDACIASFIRQWKVGKQTKRCWIKIEYLAQCTAGWSGQCSKLAAATSAAASAVPSVIPTGSARLPF